MPKNKRRRFNSEQFAKIGPKLLTQLHKVTWTDGNFFLDFASSSLPVSVAEVSYTLVLS